MSADDSDRADAIFQLERRWQSHLKKLRPGALGSLVAGYARIIQFAELDQRLQAIEKGLETLRTS
jgi:hypothetical protein